jgi:hypothetical protein
VSTVTQDAVQMQTRRPITAFTFKCVSEGREQNRRSTLLFSGTNEYLLFSTLSNNVPIASHSVLTTYSPRDPWLPRSDIRAIFCQSLFPTEGRLLAFVRLIAESSQGPGTQKYDITTIDVVWLTRISQSQPHDEQSVGKAFARATFSVPGSKHCRLP